MWYALFVLLWVAIAYHMEQDVVMCFQVNGAELVFKSMCTLQGNPKHDQHVHWGACNSW